MIQKSISLFYIIFVALTLCFNCSAETSTYASDALEEIKIDNVECNLLYATKNNFVGKKIYQNGDRCYIHKDAIKNLTLAANFASILGYKIKITDAYRPIEVQRILWDAVPDDNFLSNPNDKNAPLGHCRGASIDLTLIDNVTGKEVEMGTNVDFNGKNSYVRNTDLPSEELRNRMILYGIMTASGFALIKTEWWHFNLHDLNNYPLLEGGLDYMKLDDEYAKYYSSSQKNR